jgi:hypothetical protein
MLAQHEVGGHGGRAREFGLGPSYGFGFDVSGFTSARQPPRSNEDNALLSAAGSEADGVLSHRILLDLLRPEGADGAKVPMAMLTKLDLTQYVAQTSRPGPGTGKGDFPDQLRRGNDIASWLVARQGARVGADPTAVWTGAYPVDYADPLLLRNWRAARAAALWNLADPSLVAAMAGYFRQHVLGGDPRVHAPVLRFGGPDAPGWTLGTRAALGPQAVSRFLDLYGAFPWGVATVYLRDLDSSVDRTYGYGAALHGLRMGGGIELGLVADTWKEPAARERLDRSSRGTGWNLGAEVDAPLSSRFGVAAKLGAKSAGFLPGRPSGKGAYGALGVEVSW